MYKGCSITNYGMVSSCYFYNMKNPKCTFCKEFDRRTFFDNFTNIMSEFCQHLIWRHCHWLRLMTCLTVLVLGVFSTIERASFKNFETWGHRAHCTIFRSMKIVKYQCENDMYHLYLMTALIVANMASVVATMCIPFLRDAYKWCDNAVTWNFMKFREMFKNKFSTKYIGRIFTLHAKLWCSVL